MGIWRYALAAAVALPPAMAATAAEESGEEHLSTHTVGLFIGDTKERRREGGTLGIASTVTSVSA